MRSVVVLSWLLWAAFLGDFCLETDDACPEDLPVFVSDGADLCSDSTAPVGIRNRP